MEGPARVHRRASSFPHSAPGGIGAAMSSVSECLTTLVEEIQSGPMKNVIDGPIDIREP